MSRYINTCTDRNLTRRKYHTDLECYALGENYREMTEHDERLNLLPCSNCTTYRAEELLGAWDDE